MHCWFITSSLSVRKKLNPRSLLSTIWFVQCVRNSMVPPDLLWTRLMSYLSYLFNKVCSWYQFSFRLPTYMSCVHIIDRRWNWFQLSCKNVPYVPKAKWPHWKVSRSYAYYKFALHLYLCSYICTWLRQVSHPNAFRRLYVPNGDADQPVFCTEGGWRLLGNYPWGFAQCASMDSNTQTTGSIANGWHLLRYYPCTPAYSNNYVRKYKYKNLGFSIQPSSIWCRQALGLKPTTMTRRGTLN